MAHAAIRSSEEQFLTANLTLCRLRAIQTSEHVEFRRWWKVEDLLKLRHVVDLGTAVKDVQTFLSSENRISVEIRRALFKLREVLDSLQRTLRTKQPLNIYSSQRRGFDTTAILLRSNITNEVKRCRGVAVYVAVKTCDAEHAVGAFGFAIVSGVKLLLWKLCDEQSQTLELFRIENAVEQLIEVVHGYELAFGNISQVLADRQKHRGRKLRQKMIRKIEVHVETFDARQELD